jgi:hypothetical protein
LTPKISIKENKKFKIRAGKFSKGTKTHKLNRKIYLLLKLSKFRRHAKTPKFNI